MVYNIFCDFSTINTYASFALLGSHWTDKHKQLTPTSVKYVHRAREDIFARLAIARTYPRSTDRLYAYHMYLCGHTARTLPEACWSRLFLFVALVGLGHNKRGAIFAIFKFRAMFALVFRAYLRAFRLLFLLRVRETSDNRRRYELSKGCGSLLLQLREC